MASHFFCMHCKLCELDFRFGAYTPYTRFESTLHKWRATHQPAAPSNHRELSQFLAANPRLGCTADGRPFYVCSLDEGGNCGSSVLFISPDLKKHLAEVTEVSADGTFKCAPSAYHQLFTLCIVLEERVSPCAGNQAIFNVICAVPLYCLTRYVLSSCQKVVTNH